MIGIYKIKNLKSNKKYIGSSINIDKRIKRHKIDLNNNKHNNIHLQREYNKYGIENFIFEVVEYCDIENIRIIEQKYLDDIFKTDDYYKEYYNIGVKSTGGDNLSNNPNRLYIIEKMKDSIIKRYKNESLKTKENRSNNLKGDKNPNFGKKWNSEQRERMSSQRKGLPSFRKGKTFEELFGIEKANLMKIEHSERMKNKLTGVNNPFYGKKHTEENKKFLSESQKNKPSKGFVSKLKPFYIDGVIYLTLNEASKKLNINYLTIRHRLNSNKFTNYVYIEDINIISELKIKYLNQDFI